MGAKTVRLGADQARHILERFALIVERDALEPEEFALDDLREFLEARLGNWKAYAASAVVERSYRSDKGKTFREELRSALTRVSHDEPETFTFVLQLPSEGGAGATTLVRQAAFEAARDGHPALLLRPEQVEIDLEDILSFSTVLLDAAATAGVKEHVPVVIVLDVEHSKLTFASQITQLLSAHSRRAVIIQVAPIPDGAVAEVRHKRFTRLRPLSADLQPGEVDSCERTFSSVISKWNLPVDIRTAADWRAYESKSNWQGGNGDAHSVFWVALRFFLLEGMAPAEKEVYADALGLWIGRRQQRIKDAQSKRLLEYVACLSSFRIVAPMWSVLRPITGGTFSSAIVDSHCCPVKS